jgi:surface carbohydrate biosynthesis protein (TIGR04326 family)
LLGLLQEAARLLPSEYAFTFKSHPGLAVDLAAYPELRAMETREALSRILGDHDVAVAANSTSAAVDAFVAGVPVIIAVDGDSLNLSPLRGRAGVRFVSTVAELAQSLQTTTAGASPGERADFFFLDRELPRWEHLLAPVVRQSTRRQAATANTSGGLWARLP